MTREEAIRNLAHLIAGSAPNFPKMRGADQDRSTVNVTLWLRAATADAAPLPTAASEREAFESVMRLHFKLPSLTFDWAEGVPWATDPANPNGDIIDCDDFWIGWHARASLPANQAWGSVDELADAIRTATGFIEPDEWPEAAATVALSRSLPANHPGIPDSCYHVTIQGRYDADSHCVVTTHGEPLVAFETDAGSLAPLDGKAVTVTVRGE